MGDGVGVREDVCTDDIGQKEKGAIIGFTLRWARKLGGRIEQGQWVRGRGAWSRKTNRCCGQGGAAGGHQGDQVKQAGGEKFRE